MGGVFDREESWRLERTAMGKGAGGCGRDGSVRKDGSGGSV
jgi:hypothetical protein